MITGHKIKLARLLKDVSVKELSDKLGMDDSAYSRIERGETKLTEEKTEKILQALNMKREFVEHIQDFQNYNNTFNDQSTGNFMQNQHNTYTTTEEKIDAIHALLHQQTQLLNTLIEYLKKDKN